MKVAILGASDNPDRYSYKALKMLEEYDHDVFLVHPRHKVIEGKTVCEKISDLPEKCHTLTVYVNEALSEKLSDEIVAAGFKRVIFNPGAENSNLEKKLKATGSEVCNECTLVMLSIGNF